MGKCTVLADLLLMRHQQVVRIVFTIYVVRLALTDLYVGHTLNNAESAKEFSSLIPPFMLIFMVEYVTCLHCPLAVCMP